MPNTAPVLAPARPAQSGAAEPLPAPIRQRLERQGLLPVTPPAPKNPR